MLTQLKIENVAVIEQAEVHFGPGLNVLTGETGAGKSILIDSILAILGNRASRELVRTGAKKARIWASFSDIPAKTRDRLEQAGYEPAQEILLYREITADGKSTCRVNGMPATAATLRQVCAELISVHGQHDSQSLSDPATHLGLLGAYAHDEAERQDYYALYRKLVLLKRRIQALSMDETERQRRIESLRFRIDEIDSAQLRPGEEQSLQERKKVIGHAQAILEQLAAARGALAGGEEYSGAADLLGNAAGSLEYAARMDGSLAPSAEKLNELYYTVRELSADLSDRLEGYEFDPAELDAIEARLGLLYRLKQKYGGDEQAILNTADDARAELEQMESGEEELSELTAESHALFVEARKKADALTQKRLDAFRRMSREVSDTLEFLNMPGIRFTLRHSTGPLASAGQDSIEFLISANPGEEPKPLAKIASGGELSRIMLAIKSALAEKDAIATVIYDEIDTGVSGLAAGRIGQVLKQTAGGRQVLCVTHAPQIAAMADEHLLIRKDVQGDRTYTRIFRLDHEQRVEQIARIISGDQITDTSLANAREMLDNAAGRP